MAIPRRYDPSVTTPEKVAAGVFAAWRISCPDSGLASVAAHTGHPDYAPLFGEAAAAVNLRKPPKGSLVPPFYSIGGQLHWVRIFS